MSDVLVLLVLVVVLVNNPPHRRRRGSLPNRPKLRQALETIRHTVYRTVSRCIAVDCSDE